MEPTFSIIMPTYNRGKIIHKAIESVLNQQYAFFELIVVDDGSTDNTSEIVSSFKDQRIKYLKKENGERGAARNFGIHKSKGNYICFLDSDDIYYSNHLLEAKNFLRSNPNTIFFYQPFDIQDINGDTIRQKGFSNKMDVEAIANNNILCPIGAFIKREVMLNHLFNEDRNFKIAEDLYVWLIVSIRHGITINMQFTSCLIQHKERSMNNIDSENLIYCTKKLVSLLEVDKEFSKRPFLIKKVLASHYSLIALYSSIKGDNRMSWKFLINSVKANGMSFFRKRTLVILRNLISNLKT